jgi:hypothetical protein
MEGKIKRNLEERGLKSVDWIRLAQDMNQWRALSYTIILEFLG